MIKLLVPFTQKANQFQTSTAEKLEICNFFRHISAKSCYEVDKIHYICTQILFKLKNKV